MAPTRKPTKRCEGLIIFLAILVLSGFTGSAAAQTKSVTDLANYRGADREEVLKAGAKKKGS